MTWETQGSGGSLVLVYSTNEILDYNRISAGLIKAMQRWAQQNPLTKPPSVQDL
jgi:hypothetical protein